MLYPSEIVHDVSLCNMANHRMKVLNIAITPFCSACNGGISVLVEEHKVGAGEDLIGAKHLGPVEAPNNVERELEENLVKSFL